MQKAITRAALKALPISKPSSTKFVIWDTQIPGFGAYRNQNDNVSFIYQFRMPGDRTQSIKIGNLGEYSVEQARARAGEMAQQRRQGIDPIAAIMRSRNEERAKTELVLATYATGYLARRVAAGNGLNKAQTAIVTRDIVGLLGEKRIDRLTVSDVEEFAATLGARAISARRMGLVYLKAMLNEAKRRGVILSSPADAVDTPKSGERERRLGDVEIRRFVEAARDVGGVRADVLEVILRTLKRKEEVSRMAWEHLDVEKKVWNLPAASSKNRKAYTIALPDQVVAIIQRQQPVGAARRGPVFTLDGGRTSPEMGSQVKDLLDANLERRLALAAGDAAPAAFAHFTIHDLRTTGASRMQEEPMRIPADVINTVLLHVQGDRVTKIYLRSEMVEEAGAALQVWNDWLDALVGPADAWPGGRDLPPIRGKEIVERCARLRANWPRRVDQVRADENRAAGTHTRKRRKRPNDAS